jgi:uncharacterized Zn-finger protein
MRGRNPMQHSADDNVARPVEVTTRTVSCDGDDGADGHPKVYLRIVHEHIACPYCSRRFVLKPGSSDNAH